MLNKILACAFAGCSVAAFAAIVTPETGSQPDMSQISTMRLNDIPTVKRSFDEKSTPIKKAGTTQVVWQRPRGQFFSVGYDLVANQGFYNIGAMLFRPWKEYTYYNLSNAFGQPTWTGMMLNEDQTEWVEYSSSDKDYAASYVWGEGADAPLLTYRNQGSFGYLFDGDNVAKYQNGEDIHLQYLATNSFENSYFGRVLGVNFPMSSVWYSTYGLKSGDRGIVRYTGLPDYDGETNGYWFGTNSRFNAGAVRFEKPDQPYLLKSIHFLYNYKEVKNEIELKAYVFKTVDPNVEYAREDNDPLHLCELGELIAESSAILPAASAEGPYGDMNILEFKFTKVNPVNGAISSYDLEISDDITVVVTGYNQKVGDDLEENYIVSPIGESTVDYGYGNLAFIGNLEINEEGTVEYFLVSMVDQMDYNFAPGIMIDVEYPWVVNAYNNDEFEFANEGETVYDSQGNITNMGLQFPLYVLSTSPTDDMEFTFNGEDECDWLDIIEFEDFTQDNDEGDEVYSGQSKLLFEATANPDDEPRVCHVNISIPAASCEVTFLQGTGANGVDAVVTDVKTVYYDLMGRRVANPEKGVYIQKTGKESKKVVL